MKKPRHYISFAFGFAALFLSLVSARRLPVK
jgi:hypothetical protein